MDSAKNHVIAIEEEKKASSAKARSELMKIKTLAHLVRKGCITSQKNIPVKSRVKVTPVETEIEVPEVPEVEPVEAAQLPTKSKAKAKKSK